jgi:hypothetical protein
MSMYCIWYYYILWLLWKRDYTCHSPELGVPSTWSILDQRQRYWYLPATNWMASYWKRSSVWVLFGPHLTHNHPYPHYVSHIDQASYEELLSLLRQQSLAPRQACWVCKGANHWVCVCVCVVRVGCVAFEGHSKMCIHIYTHIRHDIYTVYLYMLYTYV